MAVKKTEKQTEKQTLTVTCKTGRRFRAGLEFGPQAREVDVAPEQAAAIKADPLLYVEPSPPAPLPKGEGSR